MPRTRTLNQPENSQATLSINDVLRMERLKRRLVAEFEGLSTNDQYLVLLYCIMDLGWKIEDIA